MLQIRGLVRAAQKAQEQLKIGVRDADVLTFQSFVLSSVETVERLCADARVTPHQLPARSRQAYYFLKNIDLQNLPTAGSHQRSMVQTIGIKNIKTQQRAILWRISQLASDSHLDYEQIPTVAKSISQVVEAIEKICTQQQITPANLTSSSRQIYAWMKFLAPEANLKLHVQATQRIHSIAKVLCSSYGHESVNFVVEMTNLAGLYRSRWVGNNITLILSEGFIHAGEDVLTALVQTSLQGKTQQATRVIREYASLDEFSDVLLDLDLIAETITEDGRGSHYNLETLFDKINREYFGEELNKPRLTWSQMQTYRKFGHYEPARDRIVISLTLDAAMIPEYVVEFVLYHEMLHKFHGERWVNGRRMVHTSEFRKDEGRFKFYDEAEAWLSKLASREAGK
ncbi:MAG: M48 family peptidase [Calothrix sp. C42_A2020_038]|nr:M48 family peptidase [Calothrix sp. C42_A2020_038]